MSIDRLQSELLRLQMHPVNLAVSAGDGVLVTLRGSLLSCWKVPSLVDGTWLLEILRPLADGAGPVIVMSAISDAMSDVLKPAAASGDVAC